MDAKTLTGQLSPEQRSAVLLIGSPDAAADTINDRLIGELIQLRILRKRGDGVLAFSEMGDLVLQELLNQD